MPMGALVVTRTLASPFVGEALPVHLIQPSEQCLA
jgi:hypothetical protein